VTTGSLLPGARLGPYEIDSLIGAGAMGEVYKARDSRLNRTVAIKRVTVQRIERFAIEALAIAALNHPHICQIYDVGPDYLVLEYLQGDTLRGPLDPDEAVRLAVQIAAAIEAAHDRGILHRDLKPANIMVVRRGEATIAKLLDFGVARLTDPEFDATHSSGTGVVGTPAYMSPEQAEGRTTDARSDIFSFGAVLYEMLAGTRAFAGDSLARVLLAIVRDEPPPLAAPAQLQQVVARCLEKSPERRFQSMREVRLALEGVTLSSADIRPSIAVLPFANLSADAENEYFADGLAEEIINALAQVDELKVIARTSAFAFKGRHEDVRGIARALGVTHVLEGSVRRAAARVRITAQLITAADGTHLWSEKFDRPVTDVFATQDEIAGAITTALRGKLAAASPSRHYTPRLEAYESLLRGRPHLEQFTPESFNRAKVQFENAAVLDSRYPDPHVELAFAHFIVGMHGLRPMRAVVSHVREEVARVLDLSPGDVRARFLLGVLSLTQDYDWEAAEAQFAATMSGANVSAQMRWIYVSLYLRGAGRFEESANEMARAVAQDPLNPTWHAILAAHLIDLDRFDQAIASARRATELEPNYALALNLLGEALWASDRHAEALSQFERGHELASWNSFTTGRLASALVVHGDRARGEALFERIKGGAYQSWGRTSYHLVIGEIDAAADWFERMVEDRDPFALIYAWSPQTKALREHPRWPKIAATMRLKARTPAQA